VHYEVDAIHEIHRHQRLEIFKPACILFDNIPHHETHPTEKCVSFIRFRTGAETTEEAV
jgi:hypothetical protein